MGVSSLNSVWRLSLGNWPSVSLSAVELPQLPRWLLWGFISCVLTDLDEEITSSRLRDLDSKADCPTVFLPMQPLFSLHHLWEKTWDTVMSVLSYLALTVPSSLDNSYLGLSPPPFSDPTVLSLLSLELSLLTLSSHDPILSPSAFLFLQAPLFSLAPWTSCQPSRAIPVPDAPSFSDGAEGLEPNQVHSLFPEPSPKAAAVWNWIAGMALTRSPSFIMATLSPPRSSSAMLLRPSRTMLSK